MKKLLCKLFGHEFYWWKRDIIYVDGKEISEGDVWKCSRCGKETKDSLSAFSIKDKDFIGRFKC
ncbi:MAG: hypothetical protein K9K32_05770 [Halanaerobiales bacterium]|nr:hypothetical protein [Halanaerobiales bacterium]